MGCLASGGAAAFRADQQRCCKLAAILQRDANAGAVADDFGGTSGHGEVDAFRRQRRFAKRRAQQPILEHAAERIVASRRIEDERSEEHTSELQSLMRNSYAVFCLKKKKTKK